MFILKKTFLSDLSQNTITLTAKRNLLHKKRGVNIFTSPASIMILEINPLLETFYNFLSLPSRTFIHFSAKKFSV